MNYTPIRLFLLFLLLYVAIAAKGQEHSFTGLYIGPDARIAISPDDSLYIGGSLVNNNPGGLNVDGKTNIRNTGSIFITDSLVNRFGSLFDNSSISTEVGGPGGTVANSRGKVYFIAQKPQYVLSTEDAPILFSDLYVRDTLILLSDIHVIKKLKLNHWETEKSRLLLNGKNIHLFHSHDEANVLSSGVLEEDETHYAGEDERLGEIHEDRLGSIRMIKNSTGDAHIGYPAFETMGLHLVPGGTAAKITAVRKHRSQPVTYGSIKKYYTVDIEGEENISKLGISYFEHDMVNRETVDSMKLWYSPQGGEQTFTRIPSGNETPGSMQVTAKEGLIPFNKNARYTVSSANCPNPPVVTLGKDTMLCEGSAMVVTPRIVNLDFEPDRYKYYWNNNSTEEDRINVEAGAADITLTVVALDPNGCLGRDTLKITVRPNPVAKIRQVEQENRLQCITHQWQFEVDAMYTDPAVNYTWDTGEGLLLNGPSVEKQYTGAGKYGIFLVAENEYGCTATDTMSVYVEDIPSVRIETQTLADKIVRFNDLSDYKTQAGHFSETRSRAWRIPSLGIGSGDETWEVAFDDYGEYPFEIEVKNNKCSAVFNDVLHVSEKGTLGFSIDANAFCLGTSLKFVNESEILWGTVNYTWDFGDGTTSHLVHPVKTYHNDETTVYTVTLKAFDPETSWSAEFKRDITVYRPPSVNWGGAISTCDNHWLLQPEEPGTAYLWSNGSADPQLDVTQSGLYSLRLTDANGCRTIESVQVTLNAQVVPAIGDDRQSCGPVTLDAGNPGSAYLWNDGSTARYLNVTQSGQYKVKVMQSNGCEGEKIVNIGISDKPDISIQGPRSLCEGASGALYTTEQPGVDYWWNNGDAGSSTTIAGGGWYKLQASIAGGCTASDSVYVTMETTPVFDLGPDRNVCLGEETVLTMNDYYYAGEISWWDKNGITSHDRNYAVTDTGTYHLRVTLANGCSATDKIRFSGISTPLNVDFLMVSEAQPGETVAFIDLSYPDVTSWNWEVGSGYTSTEHYFHYTFWNEGVYTVRLSVSNGGCVLSGVKTITIRSGSKSMVEEETDPGIPPGSEVAVAHPEEGLYKGQANISAVIAYPNPSSGSFRLKVELESPSKLLARLYTITGKLVHTSVIPEQGKAVEQDFNLPSLETGTYLLRINSEAGEYTVKVVIQK